MKKNEKNSNSNKTTTISQRKARAWRELKEIYSISSTQGLVLHHIDPTLKSRDPERYNQWNARDLMPMTKQQHRSFHMKLEARRLTRTRQHNAKISQTLREHNIKGKAILATISTQAYVFNTLADAARFIGCSKQLLSQCLRPSTANYTARGWTIQLINIEDHAK